MNNEALKVLVDGVKGIAVHNGVARIEFMRIAMDGKPQPCLELHVPVAVMKSVAEAFRKASS